MSLWCQSQLGEIKSLLCYVQEVGWSETAGQKSTKEAVQRRVMGV